MNIKDEFCTFPQVNKQAVRDQSDFVTRKVLMGGLKAMQKLTWSFKDLTDNFGVK